MPTIKGIPGSALGAALVRGGSSNAALSRLLRPTYGNRPTIDIEVGPAIAAARENGFARTALSEANQLAALSRHVANLTTVVSNLTRHVALDAGESVMPGRVEEGYSQYVRPDENGKGGIIWTPVGTFAAAAPADTRVEVNVVDLERAKLTGTIIRALQFVLGGDLEDLNEAAKVVCSLELNGLTNSRLNRVPLDFAPGPGGVIVTTFPIPAGIYVPPDTFVTFVFETETALTTANAGTVQARVLSGE